MHRRRSLQRGCRFALVAIALAANLLIAASPGAQAAADRCSGAQQADSDPPINLTPVTLQVLQRAIEPVPATDGLIHLAYVALLTNTQASAARIDGVVPVDPFTGFKSTGRNFVVDDDGREITGKIRQFDTSLIDGPSEGPGAATSPRLMAGRSGLMFFDVTYTNPAEIPALLSHALTVAIPADGAGVAQITHPVPVSCRAPITLHPPLVGDGWWNANGCCAIVGPHRGAVLPINGDLRAAQQFAIDYVQIGPDGRCCDGPAGALRSWRFFGAPILAAAPGVVVEVVDGLPDQEPVGTVTGVDVTNAPGNNVIEAIGDGRFIAYGHIKSGSIPASIRKGATLNAGDLIGSVGSSGNSTAPHLHFQVMQRPSFLDATGLPFVFDSQIVEGRVTSPVEDFETDSRPVSIDRTGAGPQQSRMPAAGQVFGFGQR